MNKLWGATKLIWQSAVAKKLWPISKETRIRFPFEMPGTLRDVLDHRGDDSAARVCIFSGMAAVRTNILFISCCWSCYSLIAEARAVSGARSSSVR
jgi:hypothetical protein